MSGTSLTPGLIALGIGLLAGIILAIRLGRRAAADASRTTADLALQAQDLETSYAETISRLRVAQQEGLSVGDREALELGAAKALQRLDAVRGRIESSGGAPRPVAETGEGPTDKTPTEVMPAEDMPAYEIPAERRQSMLKRHPLMAGFTLGGGVVGLVALLLFWADRDAQPRREAGMTAAAPAATPSTLPAALEGQLAELQSRIEASPEDIVLRKQFALTLLDSGMLFESFQAADAVLALDPGDPDALYVKGIVRFSMGQDSEAIDRLSSVVERFPEHGRAWLVLGLAQVRSGGRAAAASSWRTAALSAGDTGGQFLQLAELAESDTSAEEIFATLGVSAAQSTTSSGTGPFLAAGSAATEPSRQPSNALSSPPPFRVSLRLDPAAKVPPGATLFVFLRGSDGGPPAAVKRIDRPSFPMELGLGPEDSMLGRPLPASGKLVARLDADGSASTQTPGDLEAEVAITAGEAVSLTLSAL